MISSDTDISSEVESVRNNAGIIDLSHRGKLKLSGKEHLNLLQGMLSNDVIKLKTSKGIYATSLTPKGKLMADMKVHKLSGEVILDIEPHITEEFYKYLLKYRLSYRADIENVTQELNLFHVCGPDADSVIKQSFGPASKPVNEFDSVVPKGDESALMIKINRTGEAGYDIYVDKSKGAGVWSDMINGPLTGGLTPFGLEAMEILRIEAGIPVLGKDMDENTIPIEAGLWKALDFEKGCYIGQEVIARIKWRGRVNRHLSGFKVDGLTEVPEPGSEVFMDDKKVGRLTSCVYSPTLNEVIAIGYIRREFNEGSLKVNIVNLSDGAHIKAVTCSLPFIDNFT